MNLVNQFNNAFTRKKEREWEHIYVFIDVHDTIFKSTYDDTNKFTYYPYAEKVLRLLSKRKDVKLGLYTCSYAKTIAKFLDKFEKDNIHFDLINNNPMEKNTSYASFESKPYFNVLLDDKAGFEANVEWYQIFKYLQKKLLIEMMELEG